MAEIKSTLDLVMEKTKGLRLTKEEKAQTRREAEAKKAAGLALRFHDHSLRPSELRREIEQAPVEAGERFGRLVAVRVVAEMDLGAPDQSLARQALEACLGNEADRAWPVVEEAIKDYLAEAARQAAYEGRRILDELAEQGIKGSALRAKPQARIDQRPFKDRIISELGGQ
ncbi:MAG: hypothetical protein JRC92_00720 [Deltaproteobacteria bacterium]|nr:hypothetical protein [Deltaproteobacteria bacterium]